ncbi:capsule biosynthesis protein CapC [Grimontia sp. S25]|uniref:protein-tyrosine-phosphatase n=1 Tax=Grimontia sedimenti TaxID=2711294 RepID=A0A6M1RB24_9GAMM|nr:CpsB/CapC family capsule biosynthesis tyrosine phosphatase [Grimontia sedimenti]NGN96632.1 capsule biosynthesis protein CapC [Grimontia sedimenti]
MIDTHCHILPGLDDGAKNEREAIEMATMALHDGIHGSIATPHINPGRFDNNLNSISASADTFANSLVRHQINFKLRYSSEVRLCPEIDYMLAAEQIPFLTEDRGQKRLLIEFSTTNYPHGALAKCRCLLDKGITPVIAHPERYRYFQRSRVDIAQFSRLGCEFQITASSLIGKFRQEAQSLARAMIVEKKATWFASDSHNLKSRAPNLSAAYEEAKRFTDQKTANQLFIDMPQKIFAMCPGIPFDTSISTICTQKAVTSDYFLGKNDED